MTTTSFQKAQAVSRAQSEIRKKIKALPRKHAIKEVARLIEIGDQRIASLGASRLVRYCDHVGPATTANVIARAQISGNKHIKDLTDAGKGRLVRELRRLVDNG